jgi:hypothetical protein
MKWVKVKFTAGSFVLASGRNRMEYLDLESMQMDLFGSEKVKFKIISVNGKKFNKAKKYLVKVQDNGVFFVLTKSGKTRFEFASRLLMDTFFDQCRKYIFSDFQLDLKDSQKEKPLKLKPINKDAAKFLKPFGDDALTEEEKKHRVATKAIEMECPKSLRALYQYNDILLNFCKGTIDESDSRFQPLIKARFPETQRVLNNCREIRSRFNKGKVHVGGVHKFLYGRKEPKITPYDPEFFHKLLNAKHKKILKQK